MGQKTTAGNEYRESLGITEIMKKTGDIIEEELWESMISLIV